MKRPLVVHPILFALFPILTFYNTNIEEVRLNILALPLSITILVTIILWLILNFIFKDKVKAGIILTLFLLLFFSYGHIYNLISKKEIYGFIIGRHRFLYPLIVLILASASYFIFKTRKNLTNFTNILNLVGIILVAYSTFNILSYEYKTRSSLKSFQNDKSIKAESKKLNEKSESHPDIYYFVFDRYSRQDTLQERFYYDNSDFINYLTEKGFFIASKSCSNYPLTHFSIASSLNMNYFEDLLNQTEVNPDDTSLYYNMIKNNRVVGLLKSKGYKYIHLGDWWEGTRKNDHADININYGFSTNLPEFNNKLLETTAFALIGHLLNFGILDSREMMRKRNLNKFEKIVDISKMKGHKFVFAHFLINHPPFVFDRNGELLSRDVEKKRGEDRNFVNSLIFTNEKIKEMIDGIIENSKNPLVIIIQGDEGPHMEALKKDDVDKDIKNDAYMKRSSILNAYYLSNVRKDYLYERISPINTFRLIFNLYFEADYDLLKDYTFVGAPHHEQRFKNITDRIVEAEKKREEKK